MQIWWPDSACRPSNVSALSEARFQEELRTSTELRARVR
jgi:hypothetical protein